MTANHINQHETQTPSNYALVCIYLFKPGVFDVIRKLKPSWCGELELTDTIQLMIDHGYKVGCGFIY
ncbi:MAG: sugar phosphate nucleotidyltransferase [Thermosphaera sp.]